MTPARWVRRDEAVDDLGPGQLGMRLIGAQSGGEGGGISRVEPMNLSVEDVREDLQNRGSQPLLRWRKSCEGSFHPFRMARERAGLCFDNRSRACQAADARSRPK